MSEAKHVKWYVDSFGKFDILPPHYLGVFLTLVTKMTPAKDGMSVDFTCSSKKRMCKELGFEKVGTLNNALSGLCKLNYIRRVERGMYQINPFLCGKGKWDDIAKQRETWTYSKIVQQSKQYT